MSFKLYNTEDIKNIADSIRGKTGKNNTMKLSEMSDEIDSIKSGGVDLTPSLSLSSDKSETDGTATLTAELTVSDSETENNECVKGCIVNASIGLYDSSSTLLSTATTNEEGIATFNVTLTQTTTYHCLFTTTKYSSATSNTVTVKYQNWKNTYQQVEYIGSTGEQYLNTGYILKAGDKVNVTFDPQIGGHDFQQAVFGARKFDYAHNSYAFFNKFASDKCAYSRTGDEAIAEGIWEGTKYTVKTSGNTATIILTDTQTDVATITASGTLEDCVNPCGLFCMNVDEGTGFTIDTYSAMNIYEFQVQNENDEIVFNLIPVYRKVDGTIGMYDTVNNGFYTNVGTGTFIKGGNVN